MIFLLIFIVMILLTLTEFAFVLSFKHPGTMTKLLKLPKNSPTPKIVFGASMIVFVIFLYVFLKQLSSPQPNSFYIPPITAGKNQVMTNTNDYKQIGYDDFKTEENYYFLYTASDKSKTMLEKKAVSIKNSICKKTCTISFYDDVKAYIEDKARSAITSDQVMQEWNRNNYVYAADHFLGYLGSKQYATFTYYPYKDWYYRQQKAKETQGN